MAETRRADLDRIRVGDCMHHGIVSCDADAPLVEVAAAMCANRVHAVAVAGDRRRTGVISDVDVIAAAAESGERTAGEMAAEDAPAIAAGRSLRDAARLMTEHGVSHLLVRAAGTGHLTGVISSTDIMGAIAGSPQA
jgi:predicted transcriptional regulator